MTSSYICDLDALTKAQRKRHSELAVSLRPNVVEFRELSNGYAVKFESDEFRTDIEEFMLLEMLCCPFLTLELESDREIPSLHLNITGAGEIKTFIRAEFGIPAN